MKHARDRMRALAQQMAVAAPEAERDEPEQTEKQQADKAEKQQVIKTALHTARGGKTDKPRPRKTAKPAIETRDDKEEAESLTLERMTIKLEPEVRNRILGEVYRRKTQKLPNRSIQAVVSEAVNAYLDAK